MNQDRALVILSGGQDSTTCLYAALREHGFVTAVTFDYGQRHKIEIDSAISIATRAGVHHEIVELPDDILAGTSPLVDHGRGVEHYDRPEDMPGGVEPTFVPCRNLLFLTIAANRAVAEQCGKIYIGVSQEDFGGYFDCRDQFLLMAAQAINQAVFGEFVGIDIIAPLLFKSKRDTVLLAKELGSGCWDALAYSHTCYDGQYPPNPKNHASILRARGFKEAGHPDPLILRAKGEHRLPDDYPQDGYVFGTKYEGEEVSIDP